MLILTRRCGETINIGHEIAVTVVQMSDNRIHLGVTAPKAVQVHRGEIYKRIRSGHPLSAETGQAHDVVKIA